MRVASLVAAIIRRRCALRPPDDCWTGPPGTGNLYLFAYQ